MKFTAANLLSTAKVVFSAIDRKHAVPILSFVHIKAYGGGTVTLRGTDLDTEVSAAANAKVEQVGEVCVQSELLANILKKLDGDVTFELDGETLKVKSGRSRFKLNTLPVADFPTMPVSPGGANLTLTSDDLIKLFAVRFAQSVKDVRYYLQGIYLHVVDNKLRAVATDGHRLASSQIDASGVSANVLASIPGVIIPQKTVELILKSLGGVKEVMLTVEDNQLLFSTGALSIRSKLVDGTFPDYARIIPKANNRIAIVDTAGFKETTERVALVLNGNGRAVSFDFDPGSVRVNAESSDAGDATESLDIEYDAEPLCIGFNSSYVSDIFKNIESEKAEISLGDAGSPALIKPVGKGREDFFAILMPMRV